MDANLKICWRFCTTALRQKLTRLHCIVGASSILGRLLLGALADRIGAIRTYRACFLGIAVTYVLWLGTTTYPWLLTFSILYGVAYGGTIAL